MSVAGRASAPVAFHRSSGMPAHVCEKRRRARREVRARSHSRLLSLPTQPGNSMRVFSARARSQGCVSRPNARCLCMKEGAGRDYVTSLGRKPPRVVPPASYFAPHSRRPDSRIKRRRPSQPDSNQRRARRKASPFMRRRRAFGLSHLQPHPIPSKRGMSPFNALRRSSGRSWPRGLPGAPHRP